MRRGGKFTLGPKPTGLGSLRTPPKRDRKRDTKSDDKTKETISTLEVPGDQFLEEPRLDEATRVLLPRAQLELEYKAVLQERYLVLRDLAKTLKALMCSLPPA
jgi:hypothetical protein